MWAYDLMEVRPHLEYIARNIKFQSKEKWCKNEFVISVSESADEFGCECGTFEHYAMVCSHALKVGAPDPLPYLQSLSLDGHG